MCVHLYAEEEVLQPAVASELGDEHARDHAFDVDASLKLLLADIDSMRVGQEGFREKVEQLMEVRRRAAAVLERRGCAFEGGGGQGKAAARGRGTGPNDTRRPQLALNQ